MLSKLSGWFDDYIEIPSHKVLKMMSPCQLWSLRTEGGWSRLTGTIPLRDSILSSFHLPLRLKCPMIPLLNVDIEFNEGVYMAYPEINPKQLDIEMDRTPGILSHEERELLEKRIRQQREDRLRHSYKQLTNNEFDALKIKGTLPWLLQGPQLVREDRVIADIFFKISSFLTGLSFHETQRIFQAVHLNLFEESYINIGKGLIGFFTSTKNLENQRNECLERLERRVTLA